jgi:hypothetical protein
VASGSFQAGADGVPAPLERSVSVRLRLGRRTVMWGATWALICGAIAAGAGPITAAWLGRLMVAWFLTVPLYGALWVRGFGADAPAGRPGAGTLPEAPRHPHEASGRWSERARAALAVRPDEAQIDVALRGLLLLALAGLIGPAVLATLVAGGLLIGLAWLVAGRSPGAVGLTRSLLEIVVPGLVGWLALDGPVAVPAPVGVVEGWPASASLWWRLNGLFPAVLLGFAAVFHGATAARHRSELAARARQIAAGYVWVVGALAWAEQAVGAGLVAMVFVVQWPYLARFRLGETHWHLAAAQWLAMLALLLAAVAAAPPPTG